MLLSVDFILDLDPSSLHNLNYVSYNDQLAIKTAIENYTKEYSDKFIGTFNIDTDDGYMKLTHINGLAVVYDDFIKTRDEYVSIEW